MGEQKKVFTPEESTELLQHIATTMTTGIEHISAAVGDLKKDVDGLKKDVCTLTNDIDELRKDVDAHRSETKKGFEDVDKKIRASVHRVMDYTDRRIAEAEGKIIGIVRKEDEKFGEHIRVTEESGAISQLESERLQRLGPFPKLKVA